MKKFINKTIAFGLFLFLTVLGLSFLADGYTDPFYIRFTTPKQQNLIIGTSRAAQGLQPEAFKSILNRDISNYAFTVAHSPFGSVYLESIKRKHNREKGGFFIVAVDPWSISNWSELPDDSTSFRENNLCLNNTRIVNLNPNLLYLYKNFNGIKKDLFSISTDSMFLHKDGWLEINIAMDSVSVTDRIKSKVKSYRKENLPTAALSKVRLEYLLKTIKYLNEFGEVYLIRLPVHKDMLAIENELMPYFDEVIKEAIHTSKDYLDLTKSNNIFEYTDGNHLYKTSGKEVSIIIANWIKEQEK